MKAIRKLLGKLRRASSGQSAVEYALIIAVVVVAIVWGAKTIFFDEEKGFQKKVFQNTVDKVENTVNR
jgi:Flp pilus assembly pilin Flp